MKHVALIASFISALAAPLVTCADEKPVISSNRAPAASAAKNLDSLFDHVEVNKQLNGNILVAMDGKKIYARSVGFGNLTTNEPLTEASVFELASVSKQFTAAGILKLVERKKIRLDQDIKTLIPDFPYDSVTVRMLLNHTSGLPDYMDLLAAKWDSTKIATNRDVVLMLKKHRPERMFAPGEKWEYSNTGYALLAHIITVVSGKSFADYMEQELFKPLHMEHTFVYSRRLNPRKVDHYAFGYILNEQNEYILPDEASPYNPVYFLDGIQGDGCVNTTTGDMLIWDNAVHNRTFLSKESWEKALTSVTPKNGKSADYGFGWMINRGVKSGRVVSHSGSWPGYITHNIVYLDKHIDIVLLTNAEKNSGTLLEILTAVKRIVLNDSFSMPQVLTERIAAEIDKAVYAKYTGTYNIAEDFDIVVTAEDGHLYLQATGQSRSEVLPESVTKFYMPDYPVTLEFQPDTNGNVPSFVLHQNGQHIPATRK